MGVPKAQLLDYIYLLEAAEHRRENQQMVSPRNSTFYRKGVCVWEISQMAKKKKERSQANHSLKHT